MSDTVTMLKSTPFFSSWSAVSLSRLYFWLERRRHRQDEDVVRQGEEADFCFIIRSGRRGHGTHTHAGIAHRTPHFACVCKLLTVAVCSLSLFLWCRSVRRAHRGQSRRK